MSSNVSSELVLIPSPGKGHLASTCQFANHLINHAAAATHNNLSITILILPPLNATAVDTNQHDTGCSDRIQYVHLPILDPPLSPEIFKAGFEILMPTYISRYKPHVRDAVARANSSVQLLGLVVDMFCTSMIDVANEFNAPSYVFFTSSAASLGYLYYLASRYTQYGMLGFESLTELNVPSFVNPVPPATLGTFLSSKDRVDMFIRLTRKFQETKGIFVNTFAELEPHAVKSLTLSNDGDESYPPVYTVGPIVDLAGADAADEDDKITKWLDDQPPASVVVLIFGSMGSFRNPLQVKKIALGLERSGQRFLWSLRKPQQEGTFMLPGEYDGYDEILPPGYLKRVGDRGKICGWVPQAKVLAHPSTGGFVSHCGWNSILESLWFGVPIVTWPLYAEQPNNAFQLVKDLGLAVELTLDYKIDDVIPADDIERAVTRVLDKDSEARKRAKEMGESSRRAISEGGSSSASYDSLLHNMFRALQ